MKFRVPNINAPAPQSLAIVFAALASIYLIVSMVILNVHGGAAETRFYALVDKGQPWRAYGHGVRAVALLKDGDISALDLAHLRRDVGDAMSAAGKYKRAIKYYEAARPVFADEMTIDAFARARLDDALAVAHLRAGDAMMGVNIYAEFLKAAGDYGAAGETNEGLIDPLHEWRAMRVRAAAPLFEKAFKKKRTEKAMRGLVKAEGADVMPAKAFAEDLTALGVYYAQDDHGRHAGAALLKWAYDIRKPLNGEEHPDTLQTMLALSKTLIELRELQDAEQLILKVFHAQEKRYGANNPDLSLYLKLLASVYEQQKRLTEAQALYEHIARLFRDAFGERRFEGNQSLDRRVAINRPVSPVYPLSKTFRPTDLVPAAKYGIPVAKDPNAEEMTIRLASEVGAEGMPAQLAALVEICTEESGQLLELRSGFRSFETQAALYSVNIGTGRVTPAGQSEHQTGLAVDIDVDGRHMRLSDRAFQCFERIAFKYGFILSYPQGNTYLPGSAHEPWHWRYVGADTARLYREFGPLNKPLEFLAALPCYEQMAVNGLSPRVEGKDICLSQPEQLAYAPDAGGGYAGGFAAH
ncbi:MAG: D-alanyl-D-alanine carboxypeptidase family protein [Pseudomonadota bacterium]